jgi:hypothetical protein
MFLSYVSFIVLKIQSSTHSLSHLFSSQFISISAIYLIKNKNHSTVYLRQHFLDHGPRTVVDETSEFKASKPLET